MKRLHVHLAVNDLQESNGFYSTLFAAKPAVIKAGHAKWMLDGPRMNFAISHKAASRGLDHLGIQVEDKGELYARLREAGGRKSPAATRSQIHHGSTIRLAPLQALRLRGWPDSLLPNWPGWQRRWPSANGSGLAAVAVAAI